MTENELLRLNIQHYHRLLADTKLSDSAREIVSKLLDKAERELAAIRMRLTLVQ